MGLYRRGKTYYARWSKDGKPIRKSLGTTDKAEAQRRYKKLHSGNPQSSSLLFSSLTAHWLKCQRVRSHDKPTSIKRFELMVSLFNQRWGPLLVSKVNKVAVEQYRAEMIQKVSPVTVNGYLGHLKHIFCTAKRDGLIDQVPEIERFRVPKKRIPKILSDAEIKRILTLCKTNRFDRLQPVVKLALYAGLRREELVWLQWRDINFDAGLIHIRPKKGFSPKSGEEREVPLHDDLFRFLKEYRESLVHNRPTDWACQMDSSTGQQWTEQIGRQANTLFKKAGAYGNDRTVLHKARHTFATRMVQAGVDLETLRSLLGHSSITITAVYLHGTTEAKRRAVAVLEIPGG